MQNPRQVRTLKGSSLSICWLICSLLVLAFPGMAFAQAFTVYPAFNGTQGSVPSGLIQGQGNDSNFYGTTFSGGLMGDGVVYKISPTGTISILHNFGDGSVAGDGLHPVAGLIQGADGTLYGTTKLGGSANQGAVYSITTGGTVTILHNFCDGSVSHDGASPYCSLALDASGNLYGTTSAGGSAGKGTIFKVTLRPTVTTTILHHFGDGSVTNDGSTPKVGLVGDGQGNFYGTTTSGGEGNVGTVFTINSQNQLSILYSFDQAGSYSFDINGSFSIGGPGGFSPNSKLVFGADGFLYGTTSGSGYGFGALYRISTDGKESVLHYFGSFANDGEQASFPADSEENLLTTDQAGSIYGSTTDGGAGRKGTVFQLTPAGAMNIIHSFGDGTVDPDALNPTTGVALGRDGNLYGTTDTGSFAQPSGAFYRYLGGAPNLTSSLNVSGGVGVAFSYQITATNSPTSFSAQSLPNGLSIDTTTGIISGTPTALGTTPVSIGAYNSFGYEISVLTITILPPPVITSVLTEAATTASSFGYQIAATNIPTSFGATGLPTGLLIDTTKGIISGTPTQTGTFTVTITAVNAAGQDSRVLNLLVSSVALTSSQEYVPLRSFGDGAISGEGSYPGSMIQAKNGILYGFTSEGGTGNAGTIFSLSPAGDATVVFNNFTNSTGTLPVGIVQGADGNFYVTMQSGGTSGKGTIIKVTPDGIVSVLHTFGDGTVTNDGASPQSAMIIGEDGNFYGTTQYGGSNGLGTIFKMDTSNNVTILHSFAGVAQFDGAQPVAALVDNGGTLYGTTLAGGLSVNTGNGTVDGGTVFVLYSNGNYSTLHNFGDHSVANDGLMPHAALANIGGNLYGTTFIGGSVGNGTLFNIALNGTVTILHNFGDGTVAGDGINPIGAVVAFNVPSKGTTLFGTTQNGGGNGGGSAYEYNAESYALLHSFDDPTLTNDGITPMGGLVLASDGNLYGTTMAGGDGSGTAFAFLTNLMPPGQTTFPPSYWTLTGTLPPGMNFDSTSGTISGTPLAADPFGIYSIEITHVTNGVASQPQSVTINLGESFATWASAHTLIGGSQSGTPSDGVSLLLKFLCDIDPNSPITASDRVALPTLGSEEVNGSTYLTLTYRQYAGAGSLSVTLQSSSDLATWTDVPTASLLSQQLSTLTNGDAIMEKGMKVIGPGRQFLRLNVISP